MVAITRSRSRARTSPSSSTDDDSSRLNLFTPSYREASIRNYKIYTPIKKSRRHRGDDHEDEMTHAAEALLSLHVQEQEPEQVQETRSIMDAQCCLNPMRPITRFIYRISIYNMAQTTHFNTSYVIYNNENRMFYTYTIVSTSIQGTASTTTTPTPTPAAAMDDNGLPQPRNTIQTKYVVTFTKTQDYIMNVIVPLHDYCILSDIIGVVSSEEEFNRIAFDPESSYYDIDELWTSDTSSETMTGHKAFIISPTRVFYKNVSWFESPLNLNADDDGEIQSNPHHHCHCEAYTPIILNTILRILRQ